MPYYEFIWDDESVAHLAHHDVSPEEAMHVVMNPQRVQPNRNHPERLFAVGFTPAGRLLGVSYELIDGHVVVFTAFDLE